MTDTVATLPPAEVAPTVAPARGIEPFTVTTTGHSNILGGTSARPPLLRDFLRVTAIEGNRLQVDNLSRWDSYADGYLTGAVLRVLRCTVDDIREIAVRKVTGCKVGVVTPLGRSAGGVPVLPAGRRSALWAPPGYWRPGAQVFLRAASVSDADVLGPWSDSIAYTLAGKWREVEVDGVASLPAKRLRDLATGADLPAPALRLGAGPDGAAALTWNAAPGTRTLIVVSYAPDFNEDSHISVESADGLRPDDMYLVTREVAFDEGPSFISPRIYGAAASLSYGVKGLARFPGELPPGASLVFVREGMRRFARLTVPARQSVRFEYYTHGGTQTHWYPILLPQRSYTLTLTARAQRPTRPSVRIAGAGLRRGDRTLLLQLGSDWAALQDSFSPAEAPPEDAVPRTTSFIVDGPQVLDFDSVFLSEAGRAPGQPTERDERMLADARPLYARQHFAAKTRPFSVSALDYLSRRGSARIANHGLADELETLLRLRRDGGGRFNPWLQLPGSFSNDDIDAVAEYLCTPFDPRADRAEDRPWAALRHAQGHAEPWQDRFDLFRAEWDNENWNGLSEFYALPSVSGFPAGHVNGKMLDRMAERFMANPHFQPEKWNWYLGLWAASGWGRTDWNGASVTASRHADLAGYADYNGGWDSGQNAPSRADDPKAVFAMLANSSVAAPGRETRAEHTAALVTKLAIASTGRAKPIRAAHYESGPGYNLNGLNGAKVTPQDMEQQEMLMKSVGGGTATLDAYLTCAANGLVSNNFFTLGPGRGWRSRAGDAEGGAVNPPFMWFQFLNRELIGTVSAIRLSQGEPLRIPDGMDLRADAGTNLKGYRVLRADGTNAVVILNISRDEAQTVTLMKPAGGTWTRHFMDGPHTAYNCTPETRNRIALHAEPAPQWAQAQVTLTLQPGMTEAFTQDRT